MDYRDERDGVLSEWWKFVDEFTIHQAALLIVGVEPNSETGTNCRDWKPHEKPNGYSILLQALSSGLAKGVLKGEHIPQFDYDINGNECGEFSGSTDVERSIVERASLVRWLADRGHRTGFFFPSADAGTPDYLNPDHPKYSGRLAAAVRAWEAVAAEEKDGKTPKQWLEKWLREHAAQFSGMTKDDGSPSEKAVGECSTVANWKAGGPAKTPGQ
ncbi:hypothetical protein [Malikia spinosa]|uniref:Uncharacterized protein n=1 Tax=Malikia spinosa TaxID=86180 RepID=A0A7C9MVZ4_9BURK|nr:hypothetical protein [Malikia spinosa]MYZ53177.1 hypothetical protein [Malikia spinosa]